MKVIRNKRLLSAASALTAVAAVATLVTGVTFGLFSAQESSGSNSVTAGTVSVDSGTPASVTCGTQNVVPGDSSTGYATLSKLLQQCTYNVKYTGSAGAYLAVDIAVANGTTPLYDGAATGLQYLVQSGSTKFVDDTTYKNNAGTATALAAGTPVRNLLVSTTAAATNDPVSFTVDYALPLAVTGHQGGSSTITLTFHAVQSKNQTLPASCAAGQQCDETSTFKWS